MMKPVYKRLYANFIRPLLPKTDIDLAGVTVTDGGRLLDSDQPYYKYNQISSIHEYVQPGDDITEIGFGRGVMTVHCLLAGAKNVIGYDPSREMLKRARDTLDRNVIFWDDRVELVHGAIGQIKGEYEDMNSATNYDPSSIESNNVLILDCEGAEIEILEQLEADPTTIICEVHPEHGVDPHEIDSLLQAREYETNILEHKLGNGINVITATTLK